MADSIIVSEAETVALIREGGDQVLALQFGSGGVRLKLDDQGQVESAWALPMLARMRGLTQENGGGI